MDYRFRKSLLNNIGTVTSSARKIQFARSLKNMTRSIADFARENGGRKITLINKLPAVYG